MEQLIPKLSGVWQEHLDADSEASGRRLGNVLGTAWKGWVRDITALPGWVKVQAWQPQDRRGPAMHLHALACAGRLDCPAQRDLLRHLAAQDAPWTSAHLSWCLRHVAGSVGCDADLMHLELPAALAARLPGTELVGHQRALEAVLAIVADNPPDDVRLQRRLSAALNAGIRKAGNHGRRPGWRAAPVAGRGRWLREIVRGRRPLVDRRRLPLGVADGDRAPVRAVQARVVQVEQIPARGQRFGRAAGGVQVALQGVQRPDQQVGGVMVLDGVDLLSVRDRLLGEPEPGVRRVRDALGEQEHAYQAAAVAGGAGGQRAAGPYLRHRIRPGGRWESAWLCGQNATPTAQAAGVACRLPGASRPAD
ncbi:hypothetical protein AB0B66_18170 [Catellatospora sp. NPDC049111]|uniref:hypothetical protein n=1 Tax=Catellatospora sp. NPDC049111 TaxID=3155271 RepID=UPI0033EACF03